MKIVRQIGVLVLLLVLAASGCQLFSGDHESLHGQSLLKPAPVSPDSVAMEIIWARFPANDPVLEAAAWRDIDEAHIDPAVRRELANNGLRAGIISGSMPPAISKVLHQGEFSESAADANAKDVAKSKQAQAAELLAEPIVHGRSCRLRRNQRFEVQASEVYPSLPLLISGGTELGGRTFEQAQAIYALRVDPRPDRTALVELTPELHHGAARLRYTGDEGILRQASLREREVFDRLRLTAKLCPGETLVLMSLPDAGSRLGHYFHTVDSADGPQQKLILIRLAEIPPSDTFADAP